MRTSRFVMSSVASSGRRVALRASVVRLVLGRCGGVGRGGSGSGRSLVLVLVLVKDLAHKSHDCGWIKNAIIGVWKVLLGI
jgi:hypothetical protein